MNITIPFSEMSKLIELTTQDESLKGKVVTFKYIDSQTVELCHKIDKNELKLQLRLQGLNNNALELQASIPSSKSPTMKIINGMLHVELYEAAKEWLGDGLITRLLQPTVSHVEGLICQQDSLSLSLTLL